MLPEAENCYFLAAVPYNSINEHFRVCAHFLKCFETVWSDFMHGNISLNCCLMKSRRYTLNYVPTPQSVVGKNKATVTPETGRATFLQVVLILSMVASSTTKTKTLRIHLLQAHDWLQAMLRGSKVNTWFLSKEDSVQNWPHHQLWRLCSKKSWCDRGLSTINSQ